MALTRARNAANACRYHPTQQSGHYESYFLRANHPAQPLAFWLRYTIFSPRHHPEKAQGEVWAIVFDRARGAPVAVKQETPLSDCIYDRNRLHVQIAGSELEAGKLRGEVHLEKHHIAWQLTWSGDEEPLFLLPLNLYEARFPPAKSLVARPLAIFNGSLTVDGERIEVADWVGSQNHNWGSKHSDRYAWGQVAGFDGYPGSFLEVASARVKVGPAWTPYMTPIVLRHNGREYALNSLAQMLRAKVSLSRTEWHFAAETGQVALVGRIDAPPEAFVELTYLNPPGGTKRCLNTKLARCQVNLTDKRSGKREILYTGNRAAFELLT